MPTVLSDRQKYSTIADEEVVLGVAKEVEEVVQEIGSEETEIEVETEILKVTETVKSMVLKMKRKVSEKKWISRGRVRNQVIEMIIKGMNRRKQRSTESDYLLQKFYNHLYIQY